MFEILTLVQTRKLAKKITVIIYGSAYWKKVFNLDTLVDTGAISPKDIELFQFADTPEQAFELLRQGLTENYLAGGSGRGFFRGGPGRSSRQGADGWLDNRGFSRSGTGQNQQIKQS